MQARHAHRVQVLVAGQAVEAPAIRHNPESFQEPLREARARYGAAKCLCQPVQLNLVIREREGKLFLAAWPNDAERHALDCPFYGEKHTGRTQYADSAISSEGDRTALRLGHSLIQHGRNAEPGPGVHAPAAPAPQPAATPRSPAKEKLHTWGLLHYLWENAGLNRWYPGWTRDWGFTRYALRRAAESTDVGGKPLLQHLYIPEVWNEARKAEIRAHWREFCAPLYRQHRRSPSVASGFVIGLVRDLAPTEYGYAIKLHHHAERFWMDATLSDNLARFSRRGWAALKHLEVSATPEEKPYVIAALRVEATHTGRLTVVDGALMRVSPRYIPVNSSFEDHLARVLVEQDRQFVRPLHYDNHNLALPDFILKDVDASYSGTDGNGHARSVALHVYGPSILPIQKARLTALDRKNAETVGLAFWEWYVADHGQPPALPPARPRHTRAGPINSQSA